MKGKKNQPRESFKSRLNFKIHTLLNYRSTNSFKNMNLMLKNKIKKILKKNPLKYKITIMKIKER